MSEMICFTGLTLPRCPLRPAGLGVEWRAGPAELPLLKDMCKEIFHYELPVVIVRNYLVGGCMWLFYEKDGPFAVGLGGFMHFGKLCRLNFTGVREQFRRKGYGTYIVLFSLHQAYVAGYKSIMIETSLSRKAAVHIYSKLGFQCTNLCGVKGRFTTAQIQKAQESL